jgi:mannosylglycoprotein endo-beta-mannosidase
MRWLREGDANTKLFHAVVNGRRIKNFIPSIRVGDEIITEQDQKVEAFSDAYADILGTARTRLHTFDLDAVGMQPLELQDLESLFTEKEVWDTVRELPADRAPGPDGCSGAFYQRAWPVIKPDIMACLFKLGVGDGRGFARLNKALITLIPKKQDAQEIRDYRPISLVHSFAKLFSKLVANRLRGRLG